MKNLPVFLAWVLSTGLVATGAAILVVRKNNSALPGTTAAKILGKG